MLILGYRKVGRLAIFMCYSQQPCSLCNVCITLNMPLIFSAVTLRTAHAKRIVQIEVAASFISENLSFCVEVCLFGLLNVACFVQMDIFGSGVGPVLSGLVPPLALFSPRLPRYDGRAQGGTETGVCTDGSVRVCEGRESAVKRCHYTGRIARNCLLSTVPGEWGK